MWAGVCEQAPRKQWNIALLHLGYLRKPILLKTIFNFPENKIYIENMSDLILKEKKGFHSISIQVPNFLLVFMNTEKDREPKTLNIYCSALPLSPM